MFFGLSAVPAHPIYGLQSALEIFFVKVAEGNAFSIDLFPQWFTPVVEQSPQLRARFAQIAQALQAETIEKRELVAEVFMNNNEIRYLCEDKRFPLKSVGSCTVDLQDAIKDLFGYVFDTTLTTKVFLNAVSDKSISNHYVEFRKLNDSVCPFCAIENYPDTGSGTRASYDHYLSRSQYPFAGCNFQNVIPMCKSCNEAPNKRDKDVLFTSGANSKRRQAFFPYTQQAGIKVNIVRTRRSTPGHAGRWKVSLVPVRRKADREKLKTADDIFRLASRFKARLEEKNTMWTKYLIATTLKDARCTVGSIRDVLKRQATILAGHDFLKTKSDSILESAFYRYLAVHAEKAEIEAYCRISSTDYMNTTARRKLSVKP